MIDDIEICQRLNLLRMSSSFTLHEVDEQGDANVRSVKVAPTASGIYWIAGTTILKSGVTVASVFRVDTDTGGTLLSVFWWISGKWYRHEDNDVLTALKMPRDEDFPFDWRFSIPLQEDIFHDVD